MEDITYIVINEKVEEVSHPTAPSTTYEIPDRDNFKCFRHPGYKIEALYMNNDALCLCCIKCFIEDSELTRKYKILPLKDLFASCVEVPLVTIDEEEEEVEETLMEVMVKDYGKQVRQHYEEQVSMMTSEVDQLIEALKKLREKYSNQIMMRKVEMETIEEEIKRRIAYRSKKMQSSEQGQYRSLSEICTKMETLHTKEQTRKFFKEIYEKAKMNGAGARKETTVKRMMEEFKEKVKKLKDQELDMSNFKEMKERVGELLKEDGLPIKGSVNNGELRMPKVSRKPLPRNEFSHKFEKYARKGSEPFSMEFEEFAENDSPKLRRRNNNSNSVKRSPSQEQSISFSISEQKIRESEELRCSLRRKITGYLIFKHTVMDELREMGNAAYVNHLLGQKWHALTRAERESYDDMAKKQRTFFKKEIENVKKRDDFYDSLEQLYEKIKKLKKESN